MSLRPLLVVALVVALAVVPVGAVAVAPPGGASQLPEDRLDGEQVEHSRARGPPAFDGPATGRKPAILGVYPNPIHDRDAGEFVIVRLPPDSSSNWSLADDSQSVQLSAETGGPVVATPDPELVRPLVDYPVVEVGDDLRLANDGDVVRLRRDGRTVDEITYARAPEGELFRPEGGWKPLGTTDFLAVGSGPTTVESFVLPDAPGVPVRVIRNADRRILLAGYTFSDDRVVRALRDAHERGVAVRVLVEGDPVGGRSRRGAAALDSLATAGIEVRVLAGPRARYGYHHAKYAVVDDRAMVLSENWKPSGTGGRSSRGWGAVVHDDATAAQLARVFRADAGWRDAVPWMEFRDGEAFQRGEATAGSYPTKFEPKTLRAESVRVLVAPDNVEREVLALLRSADERVLIQQVSIGGPGNPFLRAAVDAARRGVAVKILLSSAWYVREDNAKLVQRLNQVARVEGLPLAARLAEPGSRFEKVHNKGVIVDGDRVLVGSVNWNNHSVRENREVALLMEGEEVAGYYEQIFRADWQGGWWWTPVGVGLAVVVAAGVAAWYGRWEMEFEKK